MNVFYSLLESVFRLCVVVSAADDKLDPGYVATVMCAADVQGDNDKMKNPMIALELTVNGECHQLAVDPGATLLEVLRTQLGLKGTKHGCGNGECGACTVIMDGRAVNACLVPAGRAHRRRITTIEGLALDGRLHPLQQEFVDHGAVQCGFCTPGMILSAKALLDQNQRPGPEAIKAALAGNLCRCSGYKKIVKAVTEASKDMQAGAGDRQ